MKRRYMTLKYLGNKLEIFFHEVLKCYIGRPIEMNAEWMVFSGKTMFDIFHKFCTWVDWIYEKQIHIKIMPCHIFQQLLIVLLL